MKHIKEFSMSKIISTGTTQAGPTTSSSNSKEAEIVNQIVSRLKKGRTGWRAGFKSETEVNGWKEELLIACIENGINSMEIINIGLTEARRDVSPFFPTVGQFIKWCKPNEHFEHRRMKAEDEKFRDRQRLRLEAKPPRAEVGRAAIDGMRKGLRDE
jgi:hypothetical protein